MSFKWKWNTFLCNINRSPHLKNYHYTTLRIPNTANDSTKQCICLLHCICLQEKWKTKKKIRRKRDKKNPNISFCNIIPSFTFIIASLYKISFFFVIFYCFFFLFIFVFQFHCALALLWSYCADNKSRWDVVVSI